MIAGRPRDNFEGLVIDSVQIYEEGLITQDLCVTDTALLREDLEADKVEVIGEMDVRGLCTCDEIDVAGRLTCGYMFVVEEAEITGELSVAKKISAESMEAYGKVSGRSVAHIYDLDVGGEFSCVGHLHSETINVIGMIKVDGYIRTQTFTINSHVKSFADKIQADSVTVRTGYIKDENDNGTGFLLECMRIESDSVHLTRCKAETVVCQGGIIGAGCEVEEVYTKRGVQIDPTAKIGRVIYDE